MDYISIATENILLRPTEERDILFVITAEASPENAQFVAQWTKEQHIDALEDKDIKHLIIEDKKSGEAVGYIINAGIMSKDKQIELRRIVITRKGMGFGRQAIQMIKELSFTVWGAHRLWLDVRERNVRAQELYKSEGFFVEGLLRECVYSVNGFESLFIMSILKDEYNNQIQG